MVLVIDPESNSIYGLSLTQNRRSEDRLSAGDLRPLPIDICTGCEFSLDVTRLFV